MFPVRIEYTDLSNSITFDMRNATLVSRLHIVEVVELQELRGQHSFWKDVSHIHESPKRYSSLYI